MNGFLYYLILLVFLGGKSSKNEIHLNDGYIIEEITIISFNSFGNLESYIGNLVLDSSSIVYAGPEKPSLKGKIKYINGRGKFAIPGLIDSHVHLANVAGMHFRQQIKHPELVELYFNQLPRSFLFFGYTTLIDLNNYAPDRINKILESKVRPDIFWCGEQIQVMNDFIMEMEEYPKEERLQLPFLHDAHNAHIQIPDSIDLENHSPSKMVGDIVENQNGICIKTLYEDASSGLKESWEKPSISLLKEVGEEAKKHGSISIIHAPSMEGHLAAVEANLDIIAHAMWNWYADPDSITSVHLTQTQKKLLDKIAVRKMGYQPTYRAITGEMDVLTDSFLNDKILNSILPQEYISWLGTEEGNWFRRKIENRVNYLSRQNPDFINAVRSKFDNDTIMRSTIYSVLVTRINLVTYYLFARNANLLFGTDFGVMNMYTSPPGYSGFLEMKHWKNAGVSLQQILKSATYNNAKTFNLNDIGALEKGKLANLLILEANPLKDIEAYNAIDKVFIHGRPFPREQLSARKPSLQND